MRIHSLEHEPFEGLANIEVWAKNKREDEMMSEKERLVKIAEDKKGARRPDKEKAISYFKAIIKCMQEISPAIKDKNIHDIIVTVEATVEKTIDDSIKKMEAL